MRSTHSSPPQARSAPPWCLVSPRRRACSATSSAASRSHQRPSSPKDLIHERPHASSERAARKRRRARGIAAVLALSLLISIATGMTDRMLRHASAQAADRFDLLIGAKASPSSLLLGAVFLRDEPLPLVPLSVMKDLDERHGVEGSGQPRRIRRQGGRVSHRRHDNVARHLRRHGQARRGTPLQGALRGRRRRLGPLPHRRRIRTHARQDARRRTRATTTDASRSWAGCPKAARPGTAPS